MFLQLFYNVHDRVAPVTKNVSISFMVLFLVMAGCVVVAHAQDEKLPGIHLQDENLPPGSQLNMVPWDQIPGADPFTLLYENKEVQKDIGLTQEQIHNLVEMKPIFTSQMRGLSFQQGDADAREVLTRHEETARNGLNRILTSTQLMRLQQLLLQIQGPCALQREKKLFFQMRMTSLQAQQLEKICRELTDGVRTLSSKKEASNGSKLPFSPETMITDRVKMERLRHIVNEKALAIFSDEQKKIYTDACGVPFDFPPRKLPGWRK